MIDLFFVTSPNVYKVGIALEEMGLDYRFVPIDLSKGQHLDSSQVGGAINGRLPVIRDHEPANGKDPLVVFESGAILLYLAEKTGGYLPHDSIDRLTVIQWLFWQIGGLGPIGGQSWHFLAFAPRIAPDFDNSYSYNRYFHMYSALWKVMDRRLEDHRYLGGASYSIADMACFPWVAYLEPAEGIGAYPNIMRWRDEVAERPAVRRSYEKAAAVDTGYERNEKEASLFPWEGVLEHVIVT